MSDTIDPYGLKLLLDALVEQNRLREKLAEETKEADVRLSELHYELKEAVLAGGTTGDPIQDYVISVHGYPSEELVGKYRSLKERVDACQGQPVLIVTAHEEPVVRSCFGRSHDDRTTLAQSWTMGLLKGPLDLAVGESAWKFPTERYLRWNPSRPAREDAVIEGGLWASKMRYFTVFENEMAKSNWMGELALPKLRILIGWEELDAFGNSPEGELEACNISLRDRGSEKFAGITLARADRLLVMLDALDLDIPDAMPRLKGYRDGIVDETGEKAEKALMERDEIIGRFASSRTRARGADSDRERVHTLNTILKSCDSIFKMTRAKGKLPERVAEIIASLGSE